LQGCHSSLCDSIITDTSFTTQLDYNVRPIKQTTAAWVQAGQQAGQQRLSHSDENHLLGRHTPQSYVTHGAPCVTQSIKPSLELRPLPHTPSTMVEVRRRLCTDVGRQASSHGQPAKAAPGCGHHLVGSQSLPMVVPWARRSGLKRTSGTWDKQSERDKLAVK
jgi:hypothetical protein